MKKKTNELANCCFVGLFFFFCCAIARNGQCAELSWLLLLNW